MQYNTPYNNSEDSKYNFKKKKRKVYLNIIDGISYDGKSQTDPLGMYTGVPMEDGEIPVQDADDL
jgi:hypothetical protein